MGRVFLGSRVGVVSLISLASWLSWAQGEEQGPGAGQALPSIRDPAGPPERLHSVQVGWFPAEAQAGALAVDLARRGYDPVSEELNAGGWRVLLGQFDLFVDASLHRRDFQGVAPAAVVVTLANSEGQPLQPTEGPLTPLFRLEVP